jgi:lipopolysaccharide biosynthesis glycosyltransferase
MPIHVVVMTDDAYASWCATTIVSCARATSTDVVFHVLHPAELSPAGGERLQKAARDAGTTAELHPFGEAALAVLPSKGPAWGGRMSWARLLLPELLPDLDRVLYLDADTLVVESVEALWGMALDDAPVAAVANVTEPSMRPHVESLGIDPVGGYFNAGLLLVNLKRWREEDAAAAVTRLAASRDLPWFDQDALNVVFAGRWLPLHPRWNAQNSLWTWPDWAREVFGAETLQEATTTPAILHFEGPHICKPWHYLSQHPWRQTYLDTLASTPWAGTDLDDRTPATMLIRRLPASARLPMFLRLLHWRARRDRSRRPLLAALARRVGLSR